MLPCYRGFSVSGVVGVCCVVGSCVVGVVLCYYPFFQAQLLQVVLAFLGCLATVIVLKFLV